jgi:hypothetical protein
LLVYLGSLATSLSREAVHAVVEPRCSAEVNVNDMNEITVYDNKFRHRVGSARPAALSLYMAKLKTEALTVK